MSIFSFAKSAVSYGASWVSPTAWSNWWKGCPEGDFLCELTGQKMHLPETLSNVIAKFEDVTGVSKYVAGPIITGGAALLVGRYLMNKYKATDAYDLIRKIIDTEFGPGSVADHLFKAFEKAIEQAIDQILGRIKLNDPVKPLSINEQAAARKANDAMRKEIRAELIKALAPKVKAEVTKHHQALATIVSNLPAPTKDAAPVVLGEQQAAAKGSLERLINRVVGEAVQEQQAKQQSKAAIAAKAK